MPMFNLKPAGNTSLGILVLLLLMTELIGILDDSGF
jgi:hypothetical protein